MNGGGQGLTTGWAVSSTLSLNTTQTLTLPAGVQADDIVLFIVGTNDNGSATVTPPADWETLISSQGSLVFTFTPRITIIWRRADGTEGASIQITTSAITSGSYISHRISNVDTETDPYSDLVVVASFTGQPNSPALTPPWEVDRTLWLSATVVTDALNQEVAPTDYTDAINNLSAGGARSARRSRIADSENPGAWSNASGAAWVAITLAFRPVQIPAEEPDDLAIIEEFVFDNDEKNLLLFTNNELRIVEDGGIVVRTDIGASITNGTFSAGLAGWTNFSSGDSTAEGTANGLELFCDGPNPCGIRQQGSVTNPGLVHGIDVEVTRGPVKIRLGTTTGADDTLSEITLRTGTHRLSFTPLTSFYVDLSSSVRRTVIVDQISIATAGDVVLATPWGAESLRSLRFNQDLNVMYVTLGGDVQQRRIERRSSSSWSLVLSDEQDGPSGTPNTDETILLTPSTREGNGTLTANKTAFRISDVGTLIKITQNGQYEARTVSGADQFSEPVRVIGVGTSRDITWTSAGTFVATIRLQRSVGNPDTWENVTTGTGTGDSPSPGTFAFNDGLDNAIIYYRVGIAAGGYTSGSASVTIFHAGGATDGVARITDFTSDISVEYEVLTSFAALTGSSEWVKGAWSDFLGWPRASTLHDGRLWLGRDIKFWGSVSGSFESHLAGDLPSSAVARDVAVGQQAPNIVWMSSGSRLLIGCAGFEVVVRSNSLDDPLSTTSMTVREVSTYGSADVQPIKFDSSIYFISRSGSRPMEFVIDAQLQEYRARPLTRLHRDIGRGGIRQIAVAREPETRIFYIREDGQCVVKLHDPAEAALGWARIITDGLFESVAVLPGDNEDEVYFIVRRGVNGEFRRYLEKMEPFFLETLADANRLDSYVRYEADPPATNVPIGTGAHLIASTVTVWADGALVGTRVITADGQFDEPLTSTKSVITFGLPYTARYRSSRLALGAKQGSALAQMAQPTHAAFLLLGSTRQLEFGGDFDSMVGIGNRSPVEVSEEAGEGLEDTTTDFLAINSASVNDVRFCLRAQSPHPITVAGYILDIHLDEKVN